MYELRQKLQNEVPNYQLNYSEKEEIYIEWLKSSIRKHDLIIKEFDAKYAQNS
jgi:hypothetical protein